MYLVHLTQILKNVSFRSFGGSANFSIVYIPYIIYMHPSVLGVGAGLAHIYVTVFCSQQEVFALLTSHPSNEASPCIMWPPKHDRNIDWVTANMIWSSHWHLCVVITWCSRKLKGTHTSVHTQFHGYHLGRTSLSQFYLIWCNEETKVRC